MSSFLANEAKGDWRNFKGDHYHIVYLVWSLLHETGRVAFYQGNDLLRQVPPPEKIGEDPQALPLTLRLQKSDEDEWIQLKAVQNSNWACTPVFRDLLANFLFNSLFSRSNSRNWSVKLVTISPIDSAGIQDFIARYASEDSFPRLKPDFKKVVEEVVLRWNAENPQNPVTVDDIEQLGLAILRQLALQTPLPLNELKLECQVKLTELHPNKNKVQVILNTLSGALLEEASKGPQAARFYDLSSHAKVIRYFVPT